MNILVLHVFAIIFIKMWVFHYKHMGTMCKRSNYTQNAPQYEGDCEYRITSSLVMIWDICDISWIMSDVLTAVTK